MSTQNEVLTVEEAAAYLRVDTVTIQRELKHGRLPGTKVGRAWRLERAALQERLRGGDPFLGMTEAGFHFHHARDRNDPSGLDRGLAVLIRHFAADELATPEFRRDLLKRFAKLAEAQEAGSSKLALEARYPPGADNVMEERAGSLTRMTVNLTASWNRTVEEFARALEHAQQGEGSS